MGIHIFLDDERVPKVEEFSFIVRSYIDWCLLLHFVANNKLKISYISFDHDLGTNENGMDCARKLIDMDMQYNILDKDFDFNVHSANPVGAENIRSYINNYVEMRNGIYKR